MEKDIKEFSTATEKLIEVDIEKEMKESFLQYSMAVLVSRALPDVRDGMKPVHRRIIYTMNEADNTSGKPYRKCAYTVGEVLGKYHPHGDASVYDALVRLAQDFSMRYPLIDGHGNFGSVDGDPPAAYRYTEARMAKIASELLRDIKKDTIDWGKNYDDKLDEPTVLPVKFPNLLVNGSVGIAVGMATNIPPHNLNEVCDAIVERIDNPECGIEEILQYIKGPDFPTGGIIQGISGIREAFETGRGRVVVRGRSEIEVQPSGREVIVITEIPYMVNKRELIEKIAELVEEKKIDGISYINDESDHKGMRIVIKLKMGASSNVVLNTLYKLTPLQSAFSVNNIALVDGRPRLLSMKQLIKYFVRHRHQVVVRRAQNELAEASKREHILAGLLKAIDFIDEVIALIRASKTRTEAREKLCQRFELTEIQAGAIVEMRLGNLTGLEREKLRAEYEAVLAKIAELNEFLASEALQMDMIKKETQELKAKFGDARRTEITYSADDFNPEDFYAKEDVVITISHLGYIKRTSLSEYRLQNRGGVGAKGSTTKEEDFIEHIYVANTHSTMLFFTRNGKCYWLKVYEIPEGSKASKGRAIQNVINIESDDSICAYLNVGDLNDSDYINSHYIVLCTTKGVIKKTTLEAYSRPRANGVNAITVREGDLLLEAVLTDGSNEILLAARKGKCVRFNEELVRPIGRTGTGVRGISIEDDDEVVGMICANTESEFIERNQILVVSENGYGKRSPIDDYRVTNRGAKGVKTINITEKTGELSSIKLVNDDNDLMIINKSGITIRLAVSDIRVAGRATQGVRLINLRENDSIAAVCVVEKSETM